MTNLTRSIVLCACCALSFASVGQADIIVYDSLSAGALSGYSEVNTNAPVFGDALVLLQGGTLSTLSVTLFNSSSGGNTGDIQKGTSLINIYDNTIPYAGGAITQPLVTSFSFNWDYTGSGGLPAGYYDVADVNVLPLNVVVPQNILITQQFTLTQGTSLRNGFVLFNSSAVGSSPNTVYMKSTATAEGLYTFTNNPGQIGYAVTVVPEPASLLALATLGALCYRRRR